MFKYKHMGFKTLTIKEEVYKKLLAIKRKDESFSDLLERLSKKNWSLLRKLEGCVEFPDKEKLLKEIYEKRKERRYA